LSLVIALSILASCTNENERTYIDAVQAIDNRDFDAALILLNNIKGYKDSDDLLANVNSELSYIEANLAIEKGEYDKAITLLLEITGYKDSNSLLEKAKVDKDFYEYAKYMVKTVEELEKNTGAVVDYTTIRFDRGGYRHGPDAISLVFLLTFLSDGDVYADYFIANVGGELDGRWVSMETHPNLQWDILITSMDGDFDSGQINTQIKKYVMNL